MVRWTDAEDEKLKAEVKRFSDANPNKVIKWSVVAVNMDGRSGTSCSERYRDVLDPSLKKGSYKKEEVEKWLKIYRDAPQLSFGDIANVLRRGRTEVKNAWRKSISLSLKRHCTGIDENGRFVIGHDEDFVATVDAVWDDVDKLNGKKRLPTQSGAARAADYDETIETIIAAKEATDARVQKKKRKEERKKAKNAKKRARKAEIVQSFRITPEEKEELANKNSTQKWVQEVRAAERELRKLGWTKKELDDIVASYASKLDTDPISQIGGSWIRRS